MKISRSFILKKRWFSAGIIALTIIFCACGSSFAARVAGTAENAKAAGTKTETAKETVKSSAAQPAPPTQKAVSGKQEATPVKTAKDVKKEEAAKKPEDPKDNKEAKTSVEPVKKDASKKFVTIDFDNVEIGVLVKFVSELTGKNFIIDDKVKGKVTVISPKKIPIEDVYKVFLSILEVNGFTVVPAGDMTKIIPASFAREKSLETRIKSDSGSPDDRMITQIVSLERANPDEVKRVLDPIVSKSSSVLSYPPAGILIITDYLSNIKRLQEIISALDIEGAGDQISYIPLQNASASEVVKSMTTIFQQRQAKATSIKVVADSRTNSIIILASIADTENVRKLVAMMDKDVPRGDSNIQVYNLQNSIAEDMAKVLNSIKDSGTAASTSATTMGAQKVTTPVISKNVQVVADKATNTLIIMAEREDYKVLEGIIRQLDVPRPMVYIEALIMEVNATKDFKLGVDWAAISDTGQVGFKGSGSAAFASSGNSILPSTTTTSGVTSLSLPEGFSMGIVGAGINIGGVVFPTIGAVVQAYKTDTDVSILSTPQIMTLDNEEAEINVGSNVPYLTRQDTTSTTSSINYNSYEYKDVGVILNITPHINLENFIRLKISQQVTKVTSTGSNQNVSMPTTLKRTAKTTVVVKDNETIVIGGMIGDSTEDTTSRVPLFGDIPLLGWLFKVKTVKREKTNLYVFLTPHIVRTQKDAGKLYEEKKDSMGNVTEGVIKLNEKKPEIKSSDSPSSLKANVPAKP